MPTIIVLDVSLSMTRVVAGQAADDKQHTYHSLAVQGIHQFLDYLATNSRLEHVSLLVFSTLYEVMVDFTREYDTIKQAITRIEHYDKTCLENMLHAVKSILLSNWGSQNQSHVLVFSDCGIGLGQTSIRATISTLRHNQQADAEAASLTPMCLPFDFTSKLSFLCIGQPADAYFRAALVLYQELLDVSGQKGELFVPSLTVGASSTATCAALVGEQVLRMCESNYKPFEVVLKCGGYSKLECAVSIWPLPMPYVEKDSSRQIKRTIEICGYIKLAEIGSPMCVSRHLVLAVGHGRSSITSTKFTNTAADGAAHEHEQLEADIKSFYSKSDNPNSDDECMVTGASSNLLDSTTESVCVLLHGALKTECLAALVLLADNWFGFIFSYADGKKKSNLMLTILPPGSDVVPWLGDLRYIGTVEDLMPGESATSFPVKPEKRSYSQNCVVWIKSTGLQADIQKVLRHAKKLPEKTQSFYKELNRICRAALAMGFVELLVDGLSSLFEREIAMLPVTASPDCELQLQHTVNELRKFNNSDVHDSKIQIVALPTKFNQLIH